MSINPYFTKQPEQQAEETTPLVEVEEPKMTRKEHWEAINRERAEKKKTSPAPATIKADKAKPKTGAFGASLLKR